METSKVKRVVSKINSSDTTIYLPLSKKVITMLKGFSSKQISDIDNYIVSHHGVLNFNTATPNAVVCNYKYVSGSLIDYYNLNGNKFLGIWDKYDPSLRQQYYSIYGFSQIFV